VRGRKPLTDVRTLDRPPSDRRREGGEVKRLKSLMQSKLEKFREVGKKREETEPSPKEEESDRLNGRKEILKKGNAEKESGDMRPLREKIEKPGLEV